MIIIGGGPVGCEFGHLFSTFGVKVVLLHKGQTLLPREEPELSRVVEDSLEENGVILVAGAKVNHFSKEGTLKKAHAEVRGEMHDFVVEEILVATGREARTASWGYRPPGWPPSAGWSGSTTSCRRANLTFTPRGTCADRSCTRTSLTTRAGWPRPTCSRARQCGRTTESSHASPSPSRPSLASA